MVDPPSIFHPNTLTRVKGIGIMFFFFLKEGQAHQLQSKQPHQTDQLTPWNQSLIPNITSTCRSPHFLLILFCTDKSVFKGNCLHLVDAEWLKRTDRMCSHTYSVGCHRTASKSLTFPQEL